MAFCESNDREGALATVEHLLALETQWQVTFFGAPCSKVSTPINQSHSAPILRKLLKSPFTATASDWHQLSNSLVVSRSSATTSSSDRPTNWFQHTSSACEDLCETFAKLMSAASVGDTDFFNAVRLTINATVELAQARVECDDSHLTANTSIEQRGMVRDRSAATLAENLLSKRLAEDISECIQMVLVATSNRDRLRDLCQIFRVRQQEQRFCVSLECLLQALLMLELVTNHALANKENSGANVSFFASPLGCSENHASLIPDDEYFSNASQLLQNCNRQLLPPGPAAVVLQQLRPTFMALLNNYANCAHAFLASAGAKLLDVNARRELKEKPSQHSSGLSYHLEVTSELNSNNSPTPYRTPADNRGLFESNNSRNAAGPVEILISQPSSVVLSHISHPNSQMGVANVASQAPRLQSTSREVSLATALLTSIVTALQPLADLSNRRSAIRLLAQAAKSTRAGSSKPDSSLSALSSRLAVCMSLLERISFILAAEEGKDLNGLGADVIGSVFDCLDELWSAAEEEDDPDQRNTSADLSLNSLRAIVLPLLHSTLQINSGRLKQAPPLLARVGSTTTSQYEYDGNASLHHSVSELSRHLGAISLSRAREILRKLLKRFVKERVLGIQRLAAVEINHAFSGIDGKSATQYISMEKFSKSKADLAAHFTHSDVLVLAQLIRISTILRDDHHSWFTTSCAPLLLAAIQPLVSNINFVGYGKFFSLAQCGVCGIPAATPAAPFATPQNNKTPSTSVSHQATASTTPATSPPPSPPSLSTGPSIEALKFALMHTRREYLFTIQTTLIALLVFVAKKDSVVGTSGTLMVKVFGDLIRELKNEASRAMFDTIMWREHVLPLLSIVCGLWVPHQANGKEDGENGSQCAADEQITPFGSPTVHPSWKANAAHCLQWIKRICCISNADSLISKFVTEQGYRRLHTMPKATLQLFGMSPLRLSRGGGGRLSLNSVDGSPIAVQPELIRHALNSAVRPSGIEVASSPDTRNTNCKPSHSRSVVSAYPFMAVSFLNVTVEDGRKGLLLSIHKTTKVQKDYRTTHHSADFAFGGDNATTILLLPTGSDADVPCTLERIVEDIETAAEETSASLFAVGATPSVSPSPVPCRSSAVSPQPVREALPPISPTLPISRTRPQTPTRQPGEDLAMRTPYQQMNSSHHRGSPAVLDETKSCFAGFDRKLKLILGRLSSQNGILPRACDVLAAACRRGPATLMDTDLFSAVGELSLLAPYKDEELNSVIIASAAEMAGAILRCVAASENAPINVDDEADDNLTFLESDDGTGNYTGSPWQFTALTDLSSFFRQILSGLPYLSATARRLMFSEGSTKLSQHANITYDPTGGGKGFPMKLLEAVTAISGGFSGAVSPSARSPATSRGASLAPQHHSASPAPHPTTGYFGSPGGPMGLCAEATDLVAKPIYEELSTSLKGSISIGLYHLRQLTDRKDLDSNGLNALEAVINSVLYNVLSNGLLTHCRNNNIPDLLAIPRHHVFLSFDSSPSLQAIPWEVLDVCYGNSMSRVPSLQWLSDKLMGGGGQTKVSHRPLADFLDLDGEDDDAGNKASHAKLEKLLEDKVVDPPLTLCVAPLSANRTTFLLDPEGNLPGTRRRFQEFFHINKISGATGPHPVTSKEVGTSPIPSTSTSDASERYADRWLAQIMPALGEPIPKNGEGMLCARHEVGLFAFMGHGHGRAFLPPSRVAQIVGQVEATTVCNDVNSHHNSVRAPTGPVMALMGCSSAKLSLPPSRDIVCRSSKQFHGRITSINVPTTAASSVVHTYLSRGSPAVIGCSWTVTDHQIDRLSLQMLSGLYGCEISAEAFSDGPTPHNERSIKPMTSSSSKSSALPQCSSLSSALAIAKRKAKLRFALAGAAVMYGLPMHTEKGAAEEFLAQLPKLEPAIPSLTPNTIIPVACDVDDEDDCRQYPLANEASSELFPLQESSAELHRFSIAGRPTVAFGSAVQPTETDADGDHDKPLQQRESGIKRRRDEAPRCISPMPINNATTLCASGRVQAAESDGDDEMTIGALWSAGRSLSKPLTAEDQDDNISRDPHEKVRRKECIRPASITPKKRLLSSPGLRSVSRRR